jgi:branched-chain amino acid transport system substrate-binding protein
VPCLATASRELEPVYNIGYKQTSFDKAGKLPVETSKFLAAVVNKKVRVDDTTLWWIAAGYDAVQLIRRGYETAGSSKPEDVKKALESLRGFAGAYGRYHLQRGQSQRLRRERHRDEPCRFVRDGASHAAPG